MPPEGRQFFLTYSENEKINTGTQCVYAGANSRNTARLFSNNLGIVSKSICEIQHIGKQLEYTYTGDGLEKVCDNDWIENYGLYKDISFRFFR